MKFPIHDFVINEMSQHPNIYMIRCPTKYIYNTDWCPTKYVYDTGWCPNKYIYDTERCPRKYIYISNHTLHC